MLAAKLENLQFDYGKLPVFRGLNLEIPRGAFCALVGRNGAGKSTLIKMMAGLIHPQKGNLHVLGQETDRDEATLLSRVGYVSESLNFSHPHALAEIFLVFHSSFPNWDHELEKRLLAEFRLDDKYSFTELSRGQRMLFCFLLAACHKPSLYLIDEITSVLDPYNRRIVLDHIKADVARGATAVLATNIVNEIDGYADRIVFLESQSHATAESMRDFCATFVKFSSPTYLEEKQRLGLDAALVGTEGENLIYIARREREGAIRHEKLAPLDQRVLPMEAFIFLSQGVRK